VDPKFYWMDFTRGVHVADTWAISVAVSKAANTSTPSVTTTTPVGSTIDFFVDILLTNVKHQTTSPTPRTTDTLKSHKLWKLPFAATSLNSYNIRQLHSTDLILASSKPLNVIKFYHKLIFRGKAHRNRCDSFCSVQSGLRTMVNASLRWHHFLDE
jgi:hypothetical protein